MRLTEEELVELRERQPTKCWRPIEPTAAQPGKSYSSAGEEYTVISCEEVSQGDVMRRFGKAQYDELKLWKQIWLVIVVHGDRTDSVRLLAPAGGKSGDYTHIAARAMKAVDGGAEPEAVDDEVLDGFAKAAEPDREKRVNARKRKQKRRSALNLLKKTMDDA